MRFSTPAASALMSLCEVPLEISFRAGAANRDLTLTWAPTSTATGSAISIKAATLF